MSVLAASVPRMLHHPWRAVEDEWTIHVCPLPGSTHGLTRWSDRTIWISDRLSQVQRRCAVEHERWHAMRGPGGLRRYEEHEVRQATARSLVTIEALIDALRWTQDPGELAWELWVTPAVLRDRLTHLHPSERATVLAAIQEDHHA